jgi:prevent-host-death family protein
MAWRNGIVTSDGSNEVATKSTTVSIRELKSRLSHYLRLAKTGRTVGITERGVPIGRIVPSAMPVEDLVEGRRGRRR